MVIAWRSYQSDGSEAINPFAVTTFDVSGPVHRHGSCGSRPAYRRLPMVGPLYALQRSKGGENVGLSGLPAVLKLGSEGRS
jgi:hypothetical protein